MKNIELPGSISITKTGNVADDQHDPFQVVLISGESGRGFVLGFMPNKEDLEAINAGRPIILKIGGQLLPYVELLTLDENGQMNS